MTAHWIGPDFKRVSASLACRRVIGSHTAEVVAMHIENILNEYEILPKVCKIVTDSGSNFLAALKGTSLEHQDELLAEIEEQVDLDELEIVHLSNLLARQQPTTHDIELKMVFKNLKTLMLRSITKR